MRIWYQSFVRQSLFGQYFNQLGRMVAQAKEPGTVVDVHPIRQTGGLGKQHHYLEYLQMSEMLANVETANREGYDAFVIGHFTDTGLYEAREISRIPVIGLGQASMQMACLMGRHFSLIGLNRKSLSFIEERAHLYGLASRMSASQTMSLKNPVVLDQALTEPDAMKLVLDDFMSAASKAEQAGAEVLIAAGGVAMATLNAANINVTQGGATILNGIAAAVTTTEMAIKMDRLTGGHFTSRALHCAPPTRDELPGIRQHYGEHAYRSIYPEE